MVLSTRRLVWSKLFYPFPSSRFPFQPFLCRECGKGFVKYYCLCVVLIACIAMAANRIKGIRAAVYYNGPKDIILLSTIVKSVREDNRSSIIGEASLLPAYIIGNL